MDLTWIVVAVAALWVLAALVAMGYTAWRILHGNEEMEAGGSFGRQLFGRSRR
jgi:uncharacterized membrane protein